VERLPSGRHVMAVTRGTSGRGGPRLRLIRVATMATVLGLLSIGLPAGIGSAAQVSSVPASLKAVVARANRLSNQIDVLGQQYDALKIQLTEARSEANVARESYQRDVKELAAGQQAVGEIAAEGYMTGGVDPALQLLQSGDPQSFLNRASIMLQLQQEDGSKLSAVAAEVEQADRASASAAQQGRQAIRLEAAMSRKVAVIQAKENVLNSTAFSQAMAVYDKTGSYPNIAVRGDSIGEQALRWALSAIGRPYVWGAAGPDAFDCSGLVMWAYAHVGIHLLHFTGDQWNEGEHIPRSELKPGDLIFFFPTISHVGMYIGHGLMVDAPTQGQDVQIQAVYWSAAVGYVHIVG
jgi:peptidoglycan DL-endopeptidase CwlO